MPNNILITPGSASIQFSGSDANTIRLQVEQSGSVAFYGNSGSLFSITDTPNAQLSVNGNANITGSLNVTAGITGSLLGTASNATSASFAVSASWAPGGTGGAGGTKTFARFTPLDNQPPASNFATLDTRNSIAILDFDATANEAAVFVGVVPEGTTFTTGISSSIYWTATSATSGDAIWGIQFEKTSGGQDIDSDGFDVETLVTASTNATSGIVNIVTIGSTAIDSLVAGDLFRVKVFRSGAATADSVTGDAELLAIELETT